MKCTAVALNELLKILSDEGHIKYDKGRKVIVVVPETVEADKDFEEETFKAWTPPVQEKPKGPTCDPTSEMTLDKVENPFAPTLAKNYPNPFTRH